jgi:sarcosine dehydrogenase
MRRLGKITNKWLKEGTYHIGDRGERRPATLHLKAPFDPKNERIKGNY